MLIQAASKLPDFPFLEFFSFSPQDWHLWHFVSLNPCLHFRFSFLIMNESFKFWFPSIWTLLGAVFTIASFAFSFYVVFVRHDVVATRVEACTTAVKDTCSTLESRLENLEALTRDGEALRTALTPHGELIAQTLRDSLRELRNDVQALDAAVTRLMTDPQDPATPVLPEILSELRRPKTGNPKVQRRLAPFSLFNVFEKAHAEGLARERTQATPSPFHELD